MDRKRVAHGFGFNKDNNTFSFFSFFFALALFSLIPGCGLPVCTASVDGWKGEIEL
jgi:hypothetical protein